MEQEDKKEEEEEEEGGGGGGLYVSRESCPSRIKLQKETQKNVQRNEAQKKA